MNNSVISIRDKEFLEHLKKTIHRNLHNEQFGVAELGIQAGYSRSQLHRKLKRLKGKSTSQFIRDVRLAEAMRLLTETGDTCAEVAYSVGFSSPTYFNRCFRQKYGYVPSEVRKRDTGHNPKMIDSVDTQYGITHILPSVKISKGAFQKFIAASSIIICFIYFFLQSTHKSGDRPISIAVLPLDNLSDSPENEFYSAAMHDALIGALGKISALRVISRTSTLPFAENRGKLGDIAKRLDTDIIVEGSVYGYGDSVRLQLQLIKVFPREQHIWAKEYHQPLAHSLKLHSSVTADIAQEIQIQLNAEEKLRLNSTRFVNPEMYKAFVRGMYYMHQSTPEDFQLGIHYLNQAIAIDPADPLAYAQLALGYITMSHGPDPSSANWKRAKAAAQLSISLDSTLAESHAALAMVKSYFDRDWEGAERAFRRANSLNPSLAISHFHYAWYLVLFDRLDEAVKESILAKELDPLTPIYTADLGSLYHWMGDHDKAVKEVKAALELDSEFGHAWWALGNCYLAKKQYDPAIMAHKKAVDINPAWSWALANSYVMIGDTEKAKPIVDSLKSTPMTSRNAIGLAMIYANLGDFNESFHWLDHTPSDFWVPWMRAWPGFQSLKQDPRFHDFLQRMQLPPVT